MPDTWQPIETAPKNKEVFFWIVPKTPDESYVDGSGEPIFGTFAPHLFRGKFKTWSSLSKATHWMPLPLPPSTDDMKHRLLVGHIWKDGHWNTIEAEHE